MLKRTLAHGLMLLHEGTYAIFLEILKKEKKEKKRIEIYLGHNFDEISVLIEGENYVTRNKIRRDDDICDLTIEDRVKYVNEELILGGITSQGSEHTSQGSEHKEYGATKIGNDEDFLVKC